jgi:hypothetical protein
MDDDRDIALPALIREIQVETDRLIQIFDQHFLRSCGVAWANDLYELCKIVQTVPDPRQQIGCARVSE